MCSLLTRRLRSAVSGLFFLAFGAGSLLFGLALFPLLALCGPRAARGRRLRAAVRASYRLFVRAAAWTRLFRVEAPGAAALRALRGRVVVANHLTLIDIVILIALLPDATCVVKGAAAENPFMRGVVRAVFLVRADDPARLLAEASALLAEGVNVIVFPEGTRTPAEAPAHPLRRGAARLALAAQVPLAPLRLACDPPVLAKGQPWYDVADREIVYTVTALPEISVSGPSTHAAAAALTELVRERIFG